MLFAVLQVASHCPLRLHMDIGELSHSLLIRGSSIQKHWVQVNT